MGEHLDKCLLGQIKKGWHEYRAHKPRETKQEKKSGNSQKMKEQK